MDNFRKKRFRRIESLDQKRMEAAVIELKKSNQLIQQRRKIRALMKERLDRSFAASTGMESLAFRDQSIEWEQRIEQMLIQLDEHIASLEQIREQQMETVRQQRAKVKGWNLLLEKIEAAEQTQSEKESMFIADDRVLGSLNVNTGYSK